MIEAIDIKDKKQEFEKTFADLNDNDRSVMWDFFNLEYWPSAEKHGNDIEIVIYNKTSFCMTLFLKNADGIPCDKNGYYFYTNSFVYDQAENCYRIYGELAAPFEDEIFPFTLNFESAEVKVKVYNAVEGCMFYGNPWDTLRTIALHISLKSDLSHKYCNVKELDLLPLIEELIALEYWYRLPEQHFVKFTELKSLADKYGFNKIITLLTALESEKIGEKKYIKLVQKIIAQLCYKKYEPLWQNIYEKLKASQKDYPKKVKLHTPAELLSKYKEKIQKLMEAHGYIGTYPDFVKKGAVRGIRLVESYNLTYFAHNEKRVVYHIHCNEFVEENGYLNIQFLCGTAFLKKDEKIQNIYSCCFNAKGRRLFNTVVYDTAHFDAADLIPNKPTDLTQCINIAIKKAELLKLTKEERKAYYGTASNWRGFWFWLIIIGGLFSIFFNLSMMLLGIIIFAIFGEFSSIPDIFTAIPWHWFIIFAWIGFGGSMGIITVLANRK